MLFLSKISAVRMRRPALTIGALLFLSVGAAQTAAAGVPFAGAQAPATKPAAYYLDGVRVEKAVIDQLDAQRIAYMNVLDEPTARQVFGKTGGPVAVVVTEQNKNSAAVRALNARTAKAAPLVPGPKKPLK